MKKKNFRKKRLIKVEGPCPFCVVGKEPDYKDYEELSHYLSDRAKIMGKDRTGVCSRHQRALSRSIKRARHLGLLPFAPSI